MARVRKACQVLEKSANEVRIVNMDFSADMVAGSTISSIDSEVVTPAGGVAVDGSAISGQTAQLTLSGGVAGTTYTIVVQITTSNLETIEGSMDVEVSTA